MPMKCQLKLWQCTANALPIEFLVFIGPCFYSTACVLKKSVHPSPSAEGVGGTDFRLRIECQLNTNGSFISFLTWSQSTHYPLQRVMGGLTFLKRKLYYRDRVPWIQSIGLALDWNWDGTGLVHPVSFEFQLDKFSHQYFQWTANSPQNPSIGRGSGS